MSSEASQTNESDSAIESYVIKFASLEQSGRRGANWFYWIAGMSLVNSTIMLFGGDTFFVIGLGVTLMTDAFAAIAAGEMQDKSQIFKGAAFAFDVLVATIVVGFGWLASKRYLLLYALGMGLYFFDGLIFVWLQDWLSAGFHAFALVCMWSGLQAFRQQRALLAELPPLPTEFATDVGAGMT